MDVGGPSSSSKLADEYSDHEMMLPEDDDDSENEALIRPLWEVRPPILSSVGLWKTYPRARGRVLAEVVADCTAARYTGYSMFVCTLDYDEIWQ